MGKRFHDYETFFLKNSIMKLSEIITSDPCFALQNFPSLLSADLWNFPSSRPLRSTPSSRPRRSTPSSPAALNSFVARGAQLPANSLNVLPPTLGTFCLPTATNTLPYLFVRRCVNLFSRARFCYISSSMSNQRVKEIVDAPTSEHEPCISAQTRVTRRVCLSV